MEIMKQATLNTKTLHNLKEKKILNIRHLFLNFDKDQLQGHILCPVCQFSSFTAAGLWPSTNLLCGRFLEIKEKIFIFWLAVSRVFILDYKNT